jgi:hypothetical protein
MNTCIIDPLKLPSVPLLERRSLPGCSAIYFALLGERVLYIGRSVNLAQRWLSHHRWNQLKRMYPTARIAWIECSDSELLPKLEAALIEQFSPELNNERIKGSAVVRIVIPEEFKSRLKAQAGQMGKSMGELVELIAGEPLRKLELETIQKSQQEQPASLKELIRQRYFDLMNSGKLGHQRLKELSFGQKASAKERQLIVEILGLDELPEE